jgi:hypothetical protein
VARGGAELAVLEEEPQLSPFRDAEGVAQVARDDDPA